MQADGGESKRKVRKSGENINNYSTGLQCREVLKPDAGFFCR